MKQLMDSVWQRRGISWIWDDEALAQVCVPSEVWSIREFMQARGRMPEDLPSNGGNTLVVAGLDGALDLLRPADADIWLGDVVKSAIKSFQDESQGEGALIFWLPSAQGRIKVHPATDAVSWKCAAPHGESTLDFGRLIWGDAGQYPQEIVLREGAKAAGLFHIRIT